MRINKIELNNFRKYTSASVNFHSNFTLLIGNNASGKTTILDAIAILLSTYFQGSKITTGVTTLKISDARYVYTEKKGQPFQEPQNGVWLKASAILREAKDPVEWIRELGDRGGKAKELITYGNNIRKKISEGLSPELPLLCYYGAGRLWDLHRDTKTKSLESQLDAYRFCLDPKSDQYVFQKWYERLTFTELQEGCKIPALQAVRDAILKCIPGAKNFFFHVKEMKLLIELEREGVVRFDDLSDGFRNMVAMVADIAHRCAKLNPELGEKAALHTHGIILIDELDLHLHPKWQRRVITDLRKAFPKLQFIATTHSPFIIQSAGIDEVIDLDHLAISMPSDDMKTSGNVAAIVPEDLYTGKSIEDIAENVMDISVPQRSQRYQEMYDVAQEYFALLEEGKKTSKEDKDKIKRRLNKLSAPFSDNVAYHAYLEMKRASAGLGDSEEGEEG